MAQGKPRRISNTSQRFGTAANYWFVKVQREGEGEKGEVYWLMTDFEVYRAEKRAADMSGLPQGKTQPSNDNQKVWWLYPENVRRGVLTSVKYRGETFGTSDMYFAVRVSIDGVERWWLLNEGAIRRIEDRTKFNQDLVDREKEGWLADLFD